MFWRTFKLFVLLAASDRAATWCKAMRQWTRSRCAHGTKESDIDRGATTLCAIGAGAHAVCIRQTQDTYKGIRQVGHLYFASFTLQTLHDFAGWRFFEVAVFCIVV